MTATDQTVPDLMAQLTASVAAARAALRRHEELFFCEGCGEWMAGSLLDADFLCAACLAAGNWSPDFGDCSFCSEPCDRANGVCSTCSKRWGVAGDSHFTTKHRPQRLGLASAGRGYDVERGIT